MLDARLPLLQCIFFGIIVMHTLLSTFSWTWLTDWVAEYNLHFIKIKRNVDFNVWLAAKQIQSQPRNRCADCRLQPLCADSSDTTQLLKILPFFFCCHWLCCFVSSVQVRIWRVRVTLWHVVRYTRHYEITYRIVFVCFFFISSASICNTNCHRLIDATLNWLPWIAKCKIAIVN